MTAVGESPIDLVKRRRAESIRDKHMDVQVPGWDGLVVMRLGPLGWDAAADIGRRGAAAIEKQGAGASRAAWNAAADNLIRGCRDVLVRTGGGLEPIDPSRASRIDPELATLMGADPPPATARGALLDLFREANDPEVAVAAVSADYQAWLSGVETATDEALLGE